MGTGMWRSSGRAGRCFARTSHGRRNCWRTFSGRRSPDTAPPTSRCAGDVCGPRDSRGSGATCTTRASSRYGTRRYGIPEWPPISTTRSTASGRSIVELPIGTVAVNGRRWPAGGGGYHRLLPGALIQWAVERSLRKQSVFVAYCHPYEFDPWEFRELQLAIPLRVRLHQGLGRKGFRGKFERLLSGFETVQGREVALDPRLPEVAS